MSRAINCQAVEDTLQKLGWTRTRLAEEVGVSNQAVTNWLQGENFPRSPVILKLVAALGLQYEELVIDEDAITPVVAFRKKGGTKTVQEHIRKAVGIGRLLYPLVPYLTSMPEIRVQIPSPSTDPSKVQALAAETRKRLRISQQRALVYKDLINEFKRAGTVLIPVLWGEKKRHENALHIGLPSTNVTFIFLNLDTRLEDFKFWMAHELAHVYTPQLAGTEEGEDFADAFAGALLFPKACAKLAYEEASQVPDHRKVNILKKYAKQHNISLYTVFLQVQAFAKLEGLPTLPISEQEIHKSRNYGSSKLVSRILFGPKPPKPGQYLESCENIFRSDFFKALGRMIDQQDTGYGYIQQVIDSSIHDAKALHEELTTNAGFA